MLEHETINSEELISNFFFQYFLVLGTPVKLIKNHPRFKRKCSKMGLTTHFCYFFWVLRCRGTIFFILEYETTNIEEYFSNFFFQNFYVLGTPGYPGVLPLGVKTPKMIFFGSNFFPNIFFRLIQED